MENLEESILETSRHLCCLNERIVWCNSLIRNDVIMFIFKKNMIIHSIFLWIHHGERTSHGWRCIYPILPVQLLLFSTLKILVKSSDSISSPTTIPTSMFLLNPWNLEGLPGCWYLSHKLPIRYGRLSGAVWEAYERVPSARGSLCISPILGSKPSV